MKFSEIPYVRPDVEDYKKEYASKIEQFKQAKTAEEQLDVRHQLEELEIDFWTRWELISIRYSLDTQNEQLKQEVEFRDEVVPTLEELSKDFRTAVLLSSFREQLTEILGEQVYSLYKVADKTFAPEIVPLLQEDNKLCTEYDELTWGAEISFQWETYNLSDISQFFSVADREVRLGATQALSKWYEDNNEKLNSIFDGMVKVRHAQAVALGYENYVQLGYDNLSRVDYTPSEISNLREYVQQYVVPLCTKLYAEQAQNIGVETLYHHDEHVEFPEGNPKPQGTPKEILDKTQEMYDTISSEIGNFFRYLRENELIDVETRSGKAPGGYCWSLSLYKLPFIFANFNGTTEDVYVTTHEMGHGYQYRKGAKRFPSEYREPTMDACEIHSMSMEFFTMPHMNKFFWDQAQKYEYLHLLGTIKFLPYGCALDEFQQRVYEQAGNPTRTYEEIWMELQEKYLPHRKYLNCPYFEHGNKWKTVGHIFTSPLYLIDYVLAQICAYQFQIKAVKNFDQARKDYVTLCELSGSKPFLKLVKESWLESAFEPSTIEKVMNYANDWLAKNPLEKL